GDAVDRDGGRRVAVGAALQRAAPRLEAREVLETHAEVGGLRSADELRESSRDRLPAGGRVLFARDAVIAHRRGAIEEDEDVGGDRLGLHGDAGAPLEVRRAPRGARPACQAAGGVVRVGAAASPSGPSAHAAGRAGARAVSAGAVVRTAAARGVPVPAPVTGAAPVGAVVLVAAAGDAEGEGRRQEGRGEALTQLT